MELCDYVCHACVFSDCINDNPGPENYKESREIDIYSGARMVNEKKRAQQKKYCAKHREKVSAYQREYYAKHKEKASAYQREYYAKHREEAKAYKKKYCERCKAEGKLKCVKPITELC